MRAPQDGVGRVMSGEALALERADFGRFGRRLVLAVLGDQGVARTFAFCPGYEFVRRIVQQQRCDAAPAAGALDTARDTADSPDQVATGAGEGVDERCAQRMADDEDAVGIDAVNFSELGDDGVEQRIVAQAVGLVAWIGPTEGTIGLPKRQWVD